jgi:hypothetical protein
MPPNFITAATASAPGDSVAAETQAHHIAFGVSRIHLSDVAPITRDMTRDIRHGEERGFAAPGNLY